MTGEGLALAYYEDTDNHILQQSCSVQSELNIVSCRICRDISPEAINEGKTGRRFKSCAYQGDQTTQNSAQEPWKMH